MYSSSEVYLRRSRLAGILLTGLHSCSARSRSLQSVTLSFSGCLFVFTDVFEPFLPHLGLYSLVLVRSRAFSCIGPVLGLLFIPLIGSASDDCNSSYGRRRPFIWLLSLGVLLALVIIPHADVLAARFAWGGPPVQVGFLILGVVLLDFCGQVCFTPLEALLSDLHRDEDDCSQAFAMFSFMISLGGCVGYLLPSLDWSHGLLSVYLGGQAECLFTVLILIFISSVLITMKVSEEPPCAAGGVLAGAAASLELGPGALDGSQCSVPRSCCYLLRCKLRLLKLGPLLCLLRTCWSMTPAIYRSYCHVPQVMRQLCVAQLCSWMAVMSFMLFYTDFVGEVLYEGIPSALPGSVPRQRYEEGIRMGSLGLFLQCATSTFFSLVMSRLVRHFGSRWVYLSSMASFTVSTSVICLSKSMVLITAMAALTGYAYATLQTLPYTLTCHYHKEKEVFMPKKKTKSFNKNGVTKRDSVFLTPAEEGSEHAYKTGSLFGKALNNHDGYEYYSGPHGQTSSAHIEQEEPEPAFEKRGVGLDFAILDSAFLLSQVFPTLFMGTVVQFAQSVTAYIAFSAIFGAIAIYLASQIVFDQKDLKS